MKEWAKNIALMAVTSLFFLLVIEAILRMTHLAGSTISFSEPHHLYSWRFTPNKPYWVKLEGGKASGRINSHGWRGTEWTLEKPEGLYRVAVVGDSMVEALQVELDETFIKIAESRLNEKLERPVEFMNFGHSGAATAEELLFIRTDVLAFNPDLVVLCFLPLNDIEDVTRELAPNRIRPFFILNESNNTLELDVSYNESRAFGLKKLVNPIKQRSALVSFVITQYNNISRSYEKKIKRSTGGGQPTGLTRHDSLATKNPDPRFVRAFELNQRLIEEIFNIVRERNAEFLLVTVDSKGWKPEDEQKARQLDPTFDAFYFEKTLEQFAAAQGFHHLGLQTKFRAHWVKTGEELHWGHWNYAGHRYVGAVLADAVYPLILKKRGDETEFQ